MPDHVHSVIWLPEPGQLSQFIKQWKQRPSFAVKQFLQQELPSYASTMNAADPFWQRKYYAFHIYGDHKLREKLDDMHLNPVRAGLVEKAVDWPWSSARWYESRRTVGVPIQWID